MTAHTTLYIHSAYKEEHFTASLLLQKGELLVLFTINSQKIQDPLGLPIKLILKAPCIEKCYAYGLIKMWLGWSLILHFIKIWHLISSSNSLIYVIPSDRAKCGYSARSILKLHFRIHSQCMTKIQLSQVFLCWSNVSRPTFDQLLTYPHNRWPWHWLRFD